MNRPRIQRISGIRSCHISENIKETVIVCGVSRITSSLDCSIYRILTVFGVVRVHRGDDLGEIVFRLGSSRLVLDGLKRGEKKADQNRDDRDDDEQLDQSEGVSVT